MWYSVSLLFRSSGNPAGAGAPLWEESIRLISADSEAQAMEKAKRLGESERVSYGVSGGTRTWVFSRVERVYAIETDRLDDGVELFSRFLRDSEVVSLLTPFDDE
jgi:cysteine synthase